MSCRHRPGWIAASGLLLASLLPRDAPAQAADCIGPGSAAAFRPLRADEVFCSPDVEADAGAPWWWSLKRRPVGAGELHLGGEVRARAESYAPVNAGLRGGRDDSFLMYRALVHADWQPTEALRVFGQIGYWNQTGRSPRAAPTDVDRGDVEQLFVEWRGDAAWLRAGRQELLLGSGRLVGFRAGPNIRLAFDGLRAGWIGEAGRLELFHLRPVRIEATAFDNRENTGEANWGLYSTWRLGGSGLSLDAYGFRHEKARNAYVDAVGREVRDSVGLRLFGRRGGLSLNSELTLQSGEVAGADVRAWSVQSDLGWRPTPQSRWTLGLRANLASGDQRPGDGELNTFNGVYAAPPYFGAAALLFPANLGTLHPYLEWRVTPRLAVTADTHWLWRHRTTDGYYAPPLVVTALDGEGRRLGTQHGLAARWTPGPNWLVEAWWQRLHPTGPLRRAGAATTDFLATSITFAF